MEADLGSDPARRRSSGEAWGVVCVTAVFIAITCWWLRRDRSIPVYDAGTHLRQAISFRNALHAGHLSRPFTVASPYPPLAHLVGAFAALIGGANVASPIVGENLVFVPLLTLGCYQTGRLLFGARAGPLAAVFVLGSPLLIAQFHVFMLDAPETALVAVAMWLVLAADGFARTRLAALAGLVVGCGLLVKPQFPYFVAGIVLVALARGGWRHWRGLVAFVGTAIVVAAPWYLWHLSELDNIVHLAGGAGAGTSHVPHTLSATNLTFYLWSALNSLLFAPLFLLVLVGAVWTISAAARDRIPKGLATEFLVGAFVAWLAITLTPSHDIRYEMPLLPYLAVIGTGWITLAARQVRVAAICVLALGVAGNTAATTFGAGAPVKTALGHAPVLSDAFPSRIVWYSDAGYLVAEPKRDGDVPGLLRALHADGVRRVTFDNPSQGSVLPPFGTKSWATVVPPKRGRGSAHTRGGPKDFSTTGLQALALIAHLRLSPNTSLVYTGSKVVALVHRRVVAGGPSPCTTLSDGTGVWVLRVNPAFGVLSLYCPSRQPHYSSGTGVSPDNP